MCTENKKKVFSGFLKNLFSNALEKIFFFIIIVILLITSIFIYDTLEQIKENCDNIEQVEIKLNKWQETFFENYISKITILETEVEQTQELLMKKILGSLEDKK